MVSEMNTLRDPMSDSHTPDVLRELLIEMEATVRRTFEEGRRQGAQEVRAAMNRAASKVAEHPSYQINSPIGIPGIIATEDSGARMSPPRVGVAANARQYEYGSVISMLRRALLESSTIGIDVPQMVAYCRERGVDVTPNNVRETIKRLRGSEEAVRVNNAYFPGPRLQGRLDMSSERKNAAS